MTDSLAPDTISKLAYIPSKQFSAVQDDMYALGTVHIRFTPSKQSHCKVSPSTYQYHNVALLFCEVNSILFVQLVKINRLAGRRARASNCC